MRKMLQTSLRPGLAVLLLLSVPSALPAGEPLSLDDVLRLLQAGVGPSVVRYKLESSGADFEPDVEAMLALRNVGADDAFIRFLIDLEEPSGPQAADGVRMIRTRAPSGRETLVLTNLDTAGRRLQDDDGFPARGIISSSFRSSAPADGAFVPMSRREGDAPVSSRGFPLVPSNIEVTVRREDDFRDREFEARLAALEERPRRPTVGAGFPEHRINDRRDYPIAYPWGFPVLIPFAFEPQEFQVNQFGPFSSFTSAFRGGINPFAPPAPCEPGVACSVSQRLANR